MKVLIEKEEYWPVYVLSHTVGDEYDIPKPLVKKLIKATKEFDNVQEEVRVFIEKQSST